MFYFTSPLSPTPCYYLPNLPTLFYPSPPVPPAIPSIRVQLQKPRARVLRATRCTPLRERNARGYRDTRVYTFAYRVSREFFPPLMCVGGTSPPSPRHYLPLTLYIHSGVGLAALMGIRGRNLSP